MAYRIVLFPSLIIQLKKGAFEKIGDQIIIEVGTRSLCSHHDTNFYF